MPSFRYIGGTQTSGSVQEMVDNKGKTHILDDRQEDELPADTTMFNHYFLKGQPVEIERKNFSDEARYEHAIRKLRIHKHFEEVIEGEPEPAPQPIKARGRPKSIVEADEA